MFALSKQLGKNHNNFNKWKIEVNIEPLMTRASIIKNDLIEKIQHFFKDSEREFTPLDYHMLRQDCQGANALIKL